MKLIKSFEKEDLSSRIEENKDILLPVVVLITGAFLILFFVLPQLLSAPRMLAERNAEIARLDEIKLAREILTRTSDEELEAQVSLVSVALPTERDFEGIFNAIATAANLSNTQLSGYSFSESLQPVSVEGDSNPSRGLTFEIVVNGTTDQAVLFLEELYKIGPISNVKKIEYVDGATELTIDFYYKPFTTLDRDGFLPKELAPEQQQILSDIEAFTKPVTEPIVEVAQEEATPSSEFLEN